MIGNAKIILGGTCAEMARLGDLTRNPVAGVRLPPKRKPKIQVWNEAQAASVLKVARDLLIAGLLDSTGNPAVLCLGDGMVDVMIARNSTQCDNISERVFCYNSGASP